MNNKARSFFILSEGNRTKLTTKGDFSKLFSLMGPSCDVETISEVVNGGVLLGDGGVGLSQDESASIDVGHAEEQVMELNDVTNQTGSTIALDGSRIQGEVAGIEDEVNFEPCQEMGDWVEQESDASKDGYSSDTVLSPSGRSVKKRGRKKVSNNQNVKVLDQPTVIKSGSLN